MITVSDNHVLFIGWKDIGAAMRVTEETAKAVALKYEMPIVRVNKRPMISDLELRVWFARLLLRSRKSLPTSLKERKIA